MPDVKLLVALLEKISKSKQPLHLDVDYNGKGTDGFSWKLPQKNITASEWRPGEVREHEPNRS